MTEFMERLKRFVVTGEDIGTPFCEIIKEMYPDSKKRTRRSGVDSEDAELFSCVPFSHPLFLFRHLVHLVLLRREVLKVGRHE